VSVGVVSGLSRDIVASDGFRTREALEGVIQTDAAINQGNSGGPLINTHGEVIGVNVAIAGNGENIGFALPAPVVRAVYQSVLEHGEIIVPFLGVRTVQVTKEMAERNDLPVEYGALIIRGETRTDLAVIPGSPADKAGLEENDIILEIAGEQLDGTRSVPAIIRDFAVDETVTLKVLHDGTEKDVAVKLERRTDN
jgi:S1-C subfamily serine protease